MGHYESRTADAPCAATNWFPGPFPMLSVQERVCPVPEFPGIKKIDRRIKHEGSNHQICLWRCVVCGEGAADVRAAVEEAVRKAPISGPPISVR